MSRSPSDTCYEEWKWELPPIPPRSILYSLEPVGVGTPLVESLTSYIIRLAEAHCVFPGILMRKAIAPCMQQSSASKSNKQEVSVTGSKFQTSGINGLQEMASRVVQVIETLALQQSLRFLTLLTWAEVFSPAGLLRSLRAWCPVCLEEWRATNQTIYEPLLWTLRAVKVCTRHQCVLNTCCPHETCKRESPWLAWGSLSGHCPFCRQWLGGSDPASAKGMNETEMYQQQWITEQLGDLLAIAPTIAVPPARARVREVLDHFCQQMSQGNRKAFARGLNLPWSTFSMWKSRQCLPNFEVFLSICAAGEVPLQACLFDEMATLSFQPRGRAQRYRKDRRPQAKPHCCKSSQIQQAMEMILKSDENPPPSLKEVAQQLGFTAKSLQKHFPELCGAIVARRRAFLQKRKQIIMQQRYEEVSHAARQLAAQGKRPTHKNLVKVLPKPGILRSPEIRNAWQAVFCEFDRMI